MATFKVQENGISLRFGDTDTAVPERVVAADTRPNIVVAVGPATSRPTVSVRMTVRGGLPRSFTLNPKARSRDEELFEGSFPELRAGERVTYSVLISVARAGQTLQLDSAAFAGGERTFDVEDPESAGVAPPPEGGSERSTDIGNFALGVTRGDSAAAGRVLDELRRGGATKPSDLADMSADALSDVLERARAAQPEERATRVDALRAAVSRAFPTATLAPVRAPLPETTVRTEGQTVTVALDTIARAWSNNAGLDLLRMDISRGSKDRATLDLSGLEAPQRKAFIRDLQARRGAAAAAGSAELAEKLLKKRITSPGAMSPAQLAKETGISLGRATKVRDRDLHRFGRLSHGVFTLIDAHSGGLQNTAVGNLRRAKVIDFVRSGARGDTFDGLDNLQKLFGDLDSCDCKHCDSILGPAAYFVDLMHFVQTHVLDEDVREGEAPFRGKQGHPLHLKTRRPDLWGLPLTCENTHTEISQLQLTSEIFEGFIAREHGIADGADRRTITTAVYKTVLPAGRHSVLQPFHLPIAELEIYLQHFKLRRVDVAERLGEPEEVQLRAALGLTKIQADLITNSDPSDGNIRNKLGIVPANDILTMRELVTATQLPRIDLGEILKSRFVGGENPLTIRSEKKSPESVQFDIERVHGVTLPHLDRVHRLLRLQRHLPWLPRELDAFIASCPAKTLDATVLADAGRAALLKERFKASPHELCALAGEMPDLVIDRRKGPQDRERTPYDLLFNLPDLMRLEKRYPDAALRYDAAEISSLAQERALRLRAALGVDEAGLASLVEGLAHELFANTPSDSATALSRFFGLRLHASPRPVLPPSAPPIDPRPLPPPAAGDRSFPLDGRNLSLVFRHATLARWLKLDVAELFTLIRLTPNVGSHVAGLRGALAVVRFHDWWKSTPLSLEALTLLLAPAKALTGAVEDLWKALQAWLKEQDAVSVADTFLTQVEGVGEDLSRTIIALNLGKVFDKDRGRYRIIATSKRTDLDLAPIDGKPIDANALRKLIWSHHPDERLPRALAEALEVNVEVARTVVTAALAGLGAPPSSDFLVDGPLPTNLKPAVLAMLRLNGMVAALRIAPSTLELMAANAAAFGVADWSAPSPDALRRISSTQALLKARFRDDAARALAELRRLLADKNTLADVAVVLLGIDSSVARDLVKTLRIPTDSVEALFTVQGYAELAATLGVDATALKGIVSDDVEASWAASTAVVAGFRANYADEATWLEKATPYQERVLEKKRNGLIDWMLHGPDADFPDAREMYKHFLIDPEVDGAFRTSRIVAACSSLQLYVHRIRMNLEKESKDGLRVPPSLIPDEEWDWRQHYRVWEANRKIFLWPENYLDPTTRDDKTPLFHALESELLQQEITKQTVIDAYSSYLNGLEELARLQFAGAYHHYLEDEESGEVTDVIYLFGATGGEAPTHYWREIRNLARSQEDELASPHHGPWCKVETRIPTRHVSPVVHDGQLHVFWNEISTTSQNAVNEGKSRFIGYSHRYALKFTTLRVDGAWTPPESISLQGSAPAFEESDCSIDDPLAEKAELQAFIEAFFANFSPWFGVYRDSNVDLEEARKNILVPRWDVDLHTKAREGYTVDGFLWERPHVSIDPSYGHRMLVNCAGQLVRGALDLFDRQVLRTTDTRHATSPAAESALLAFRSNVFGAPLWMGGSSATEGLPDFTVLTRGSSSLSQVKWSACPFDYPVAAALALNAGNLEVFKRHWGSDPGWSSTATKVANVAADAGTWAVAGTPDETIIETEDELLLLQPSATVTGHYVLHRLGTTLVRDLERRLFEAGLDGLLSTAYQLGLSEPAPPVNGPRTHDRTIRNPIANDAAYGIYYQEIFQHIPLLIAHHLNSQGRFEHAQRWYHYVFDPTTPEPTTDPNAPETDRNWKYRQFRGLEQAKLRDVLSDTTAIQKYREDPFNAHAIARLRVSAYQKATVMRYIDNLLDWADERFTVFQMETVNQAMMLYVTAAEILGPRPLQLGACGELGGDARTYDKLKDAISGDGEFLLEIEELIPASVRAVPPTAGPPLLGPAFGLRGLLGFPLSAATVSGGAAGPALMLGNAPATAVAAANPSGAASSPPGGAAVTVGSAAGPSASHPSATVAATRTGAAAVNASRGTTGFLVPQTDSGSVASSAIASDSTRTPRWLLRVIGSGGAAGANKGLSAGAAVRVKAALAQTRTPELVKAFSLRQQYAHLGGRWTMKAGQRLLPTLGDRFSRAMVRQVSAAFCIPRNEVLEGYWTRVEDRIRKIRACQDITGRRRKLSLFAPVIDPMLLARARAAGIAIEDALGAIEGTIPQYRFAYLLQKAKEFAGTVQSFGAALQSALERKDSEELVRLQATQGQQLLALTTRAKEWELESARANLESMRRRKTAVENRRAYYAGLLDAGLSEWETAEAIATHTASVLSGSAATLEFVSAVLHLTPQVGSPFAMKYGGLETGTSVDKVHGGTRALADVARAVAASSALEARNDRRAEEWRFQRDQSKDEVTQLEKQIEASEIACDLAEHAIKLHEKNIAQNTELLEYHEEKFSGLGLYTWLASQLQRTYREAFEMAYRMTRHAELAYRFEREDYTSELLPRQYWEPARAGLLAGNLLALDLQSLEQRYMETDAPKRELSDHFFSLRQWNPQALIELRQKGECKFTVPELFFDLASPGDYRRRLRSVRVTIPAVAGPYVNVMATLSLDASWMRYEPSLDPQDAPRPRVDSITTSSARNDAGAFELNFRGEKYVPFEGAGAVSKWLLQLPTSVRMFDYGTISDVILHLDYTASWDETHRKVVQGVIGGAVKSVEERLAADGVARTFDLKAEFPAEYARLVRGEEARIDITSDHLPFFMRSAKAKAGSKLTFVPGENKATPTDVIFDGAPLGAPTAAAGAASLPIQIAGPGPWTHAFRVVGLAPGSAVYLSIRFGG